MADPPQTVPSSINTGGGMYVEGGASTGGGDIVSRDKIINQYYQLDMAQLVEQIKKLLPNGEIAGQQLTEVLRDFRKLHSVLLGWKDLHNDLNDILYFLGQFTTEVERLYNNKEIPDPLKLKNSWGKIHRLVKTITEKASVPGPVVEKPFKEEGGVLDGPRWAVELRAASRDLEALLAQPAPPINEIYSATSIFADAAEYHMREADQHLLKTAGELNDLSSIVLRSLPHDQP